METMEVQADYTKCAAKGDERLKSISERQGWEVSEIQSPEANAGWGRADDHRDPRQSGWRDPAFTWGQDSWGSGYIQGQNSALQLWNQKGLI